MKVRDTSLMAYIGISTDGRMEKRRAQVYNAIKNSVVPLTRQEISQKHKLLLNSVLPRVRELLDAGAIVETTNHIRCSITGEKAYGLMITDIDLTMQANVYHRATKLEALIHNLIDKHCILLNYEEMQELKQLSKYERVK